MMVSIYSCRDNENCEMRILTHSEIYERAQKGDFLPKNIKTYSPSETIIEKDSILKYDRNKFALSQYVDCRDSIVKLVVRPINSNDIDLRRKIDSLYSSNLDLAIKRIKYVERDTTLQKKMIEIAIFNMPVELIKINCDSIKQLLSVAFTKDQNNRKAINLIIDKENLNLVESISEFCGLEAVQNLGEESIYQFFMIIQHGPSKYREKYLDFFKRNATRGLLNKSTLALMIDRTLIEKGKKQLYGTQYKKNQTTGQVEFYPLQDSLNIDSLRNSMGLQPFNQYFPNIKNQK